MLHTISWMVTLAPEPARPRVCARVLKWFISGGIAGGAVMGAAIALAARELVDVAGPLPTISVAGAAVLAAIYAGHEANVWHVPRPQFGHQVPEAWRKIFSPSVASFIYGFGLGTIYLTRLGSLVAYPLVLLLLGMGRTPGAIVAIMAAVGLVRTSTAFLIPFLRLESANSEAVLELMRKYSRSAKRGDLLTLLFVMVFLVVGLLSYHVL
jgi:hypothetical protein